MKKILFSLSLAIAAAVNVTVLAQDSNENPGDSHPRICYASYNLGGAITIVKCGNCQEIPEVSSYWDQSTC